MFVVLFVGALSKWHGYKGLDVLLQALRICVRSSGRIRLLVVGDGNLRAQYEAMARDLGLKGKAIFAGNVHDDELPRFYTASDVLALPSKDMSEGFGLTLLEANASGRPCIGSDTGGIPEVIHDGYNGRLVQPNDSRALAEGILSLYENKDVRGRMRENSRKLALSYDWKVVADKMETTYLASITR
jgi:glycosyltransferase involved in cell wall biosynthesis